MRHSLWMVILVFSILLSSFSYAKAPTEDKYFEALQQYSKVLNMIEEDYVTEVSRKDLIEKSIKGMLEELDPHSTYLDANDFEDIRNSSKGEFSGIGIEISQKNGYPLIIAPIEDTPAAKAGLQSGDLIVAIEEELTQGLSLNQVVEKLRGKTGKPVTITILRNELAPFSVTLVRAAIPLTSVKLNELEDGYVHLRLTRFNGQTTASMHKLIADYRKKNKLKGVILDLRNNPGGLLDQAVTVAGTFLPEELIVYTQGKNINSRRDFPPKKGAKYAPVISKENALKDIPLVILVNAGSASASEIVAGAIKDHKRGLIIGEKTFGKGSVQSVEPLSATSAIKLTTSLYYTPDGISIQAKGIEPDFELPFEMPKEDDNAENRLVFREKGLTKHIETKNANPKKETEEKSKTILKNDNQIRMGLTVVKQMSHFKR